MAIHKKKKVHEPLPGLDPAYIAFGKRLIEFRTAHQLSILDLEKVCKGARNTSKSQLYLLENGQARTEICEDVMPTLNTILREYLYERGYAPSKIEDDLQELFNFEDRNMIINRCEMTAPAIKFFGLKDDPFDVDRIPSEDEIFTNKSLDEIAARAKDAVLYKRFVAVIGAVGTGKTSLKVRVDRELAQATAKTHLIYPEFFDMNAVSVAAIAAYILEEFEVPMPRSSTARVRKIKQLLTSLEKDDIRIALVFDECHRLNDKVLIALKNFWEMTNGGYSRLIGILLFGQPRFIEMTLRDVKFREIAERVQVLEMPSIAKSAADYLGHRIAAVGGDINQLFDPRALARICHAAKTPLELGNIANNALMEAFKLEETQVVASMLKLRDEPQLRGIRKAA